MNKNTKNKDDLTPKNIKVNTQVKPEDFEPVSCETEKVCWNEVENDTVLINPDPDSMESRG